MMETDRQGQSAEGNVNQSIVPIKDVAEQLGVETFSVLQAVLRLDIPVLVDERLFYQRLVQSKTYELGLQRELSIISKAEVLMTIPEASKVTGYTEKELRRIHKEQGWPRKGNYRMVPSDEFLKYEETKQSEHRR